MLPQSIVKLIGKPWSELHCGQLTYVVARDLGVDAEPEDFCIDLTRTDCARRVEEAHERRASRWRELGEGEALKVGDVLLSEGREDVGGLHLSTVVEVEPIARVVTTARATGAVVKPLSRVPKPLGIYRRRPSV